MPDLLQDVRLRLRVRHLVAPNHRLLLEDLHRVDVGAALLAHKHDLAKAALAEHLQQVEVFEGHARHAVGDPNLRLLVHGRGLCSLRRRLHVLGQVLA